MTAPIQDRKPAAFVDIPLDNDMPPSGMPPVDATRPSLTPSGPLVHLSQEPRDTDAPAPASWFQQLSGVATGVASAATGAMQGAVQNVYDGVTGVVQRAQELMQPVRAPTAEQTGQAYDVLCARAGSEPRFPHAVLLHGQALQFPNQVRQIELLGSHCRSVLAACGIDPAADPVLQKLETLPRDIASRVYAQLAEEKALQTLDEPGATDANLTTRLVRAQMSAAAQAWDGLRTELTAALLREGADNSVTSLALGAVPGSTPASDDAPVAGSARDLRRQYLRELHAYCGLQSQLMDARNINPTATVAGLDAAARFTAYYGEEAPLIGRSTSAETGGGLGVDVSAPGLEMKLPGGRTLKSWSLNGNLAASGWASQSLLADVDNDFNFMNGFGERAQGSAGLGVGAFSVGATGTLTRTQTSYDERSKPGQTLTSFFVQNMVAPQNRIVAGIKQATRVPREALTYLVGGERAHTQALRDTERFSAQTLHDGIHNAQALQASAGRMQALGEQIFALQQVPPAQVDLSLMAADAFPTLAERRTLGEPGGAADKLRSHPSTLPPLSAPAGASSKTQPMLADPACWSIQVHQAGLTGSGPFAPSAAKPNAQGVLPPGSGFQLNWFAGLPMLFCVPTITKSELRLTRLEPMSAAHKDGNPGLALQAVQQAAAHIVRQTCPDAVPTDAAPFGNAPLLSGLHGLLPCGRDGQPLVRISEPLHDKTLDEASTALRLYNNRAELAPYFRSLLQALETGVFGEPGTGLSPGQLFDSLVEPYRRQRQQYYTMIGLISNAQGAARAGDTEGENDCLDSLHALFGVQGQQRVSAESSHDDKQRAYLLFHATCDLQLNLLERMFQMGKAYHDFSMGYLRPHEPRVLMASEVLPTLQAERDATAADMVTGDSGLHPVWLQRSQFVAPESYSRSQTKGWSFSFGFNPGALAALVRNVPQTGWMPSGGAFLSNVGKVTATINLEKRQHTEHPAGHRTQVGVQASIALNGVVPLGAELIKPLAVFLAQAVMQGCQEFDSATLDTLRDSVTTDLYNLLHRDGLMAVLGTKSNGLTIQFRYEHPLPTSQETEAQPFRLSYMRLGPNVAGDAGVGDSSNWKIKGKMVNTRVQPSLILRKNDFMPEVFRAGESVRALLTYYNTLSPAMAPAPGGGIDFDRFQAQLSAPESRRLRQTWFSARESDAFCGVLRVMPAAEITLVQPDGAPSGRNEIEYVFHGSRQHDQSPALRRHRVQLQEAQWSPARAFAPSVAAPTSGWERMQGILAQHCDPMFSAILGHSYDGGPEQRRTLVEHLRRQQHTIRHMDSEERLAFYTQARPPGAQWDGRAVLNAVTDTMQLLAAVSTAERLSDYYASRVHSASLDYCLKGIDPGTPAAEQAAAEHAAAAGRSAPVAADAVRAALERAQAHEMAVHYSGRPMAAPPPLHVARRTPSGRDAPQATTPNVQRPTRLGLTGLASDGRFGGESQGPTKVVPGAAGAAPGRDAWPSTALHVPSAPTLSRFLSAYQRLAARAETAPHGLEPAGAGTPVATRDDLTAAMKRPAPLANQRPFASLLDPLGFYALPNAGGGNCLYAALLGGVGRPVPATRLQAVRESVADQMARMPDTSAQMTQNALSIANLLYLHQRAEYAQLERTGALQQAVPNGTRALLEAVDGVYSDEFSIQAYCRHRDATRAPGTPPTEVVVFSEHDGRILRVDGGAITRIDTRGLDAAALRDAARDALAAGGQALLWRGDHFERVLPMDRF